MNNRILIILAVLFFQAQSYSQDISSGRVTYTVTLLTKELLENVKQREKTPTTEYVNQLYRNAKDVKAEVTFNESISKYALVESLQNEANKSINLTEHFAGGDNIYYYLREGSKNLRQTSTLGETFLVLSKRPQWKITAESKTIGQYKCYKAIETSGTSKYPTIAWFAPEINFPFGPLGFNGLPGLILELNTSRNFVWKAEEISFNSTPTGIRIPEEFPIISAEEYKEKAMKAVPEFFD